nr:hypothetical protein [Gammaproteobacteria bacterium]
LAPPVRLQQKITDAKTRQRIQVIFVAIALVAVLLFCFLVLGFVSPDQSRHDVDSELSAIPNKPDISLNTVEQLRQQYLNALTEYENTFRPELDKIDLFAWNQERSKQLALIKDKALSEFTESDYGNAVTTITELNELAKTTIADSRHKFQQALSSAQKAYQTDQYDEATLKIKQALMLDKTSDAAIKLFAKIETMPDILRLLEQINTAQIENNPHKELKLIQDLLNISPGRSSALKRKQILVNHIRDKNFNTTIAQSYQALKRGDVQAAQQKINMAKAIYSHRKEVKDVSIALQTLAKKQRLNRYRETIQQAIASDDWETVKQQATRALQDQGDDKATQETLEDATAIVALARTFDTALKHPYRLTYQKLVEKLNTRLTEAKAFSNSSPSLSNQAQQLSRLTKQMNNTIQVNVTSDNQTNISVRGVGKIGKTQLKTLRLLPGQYTFEGKRKGFKSKLIEVLIPYDTNSFHLDIRCDEPI